MRKNKPGIERNPVSVEPAHEEYTTFRAELLGIVRARYMILGFVIGAIGIITALALTEIQPEFLAWVPFAYGLVLVPSSLINHFLTVHYRRLDAYLWARFDAVYDAFLFQRAYTRFRKGLKFKVAYAEPLIITYGGLTVFAVVLSIMLNLGEEGFGIAVITCMVVFLLQAVMLGSTQSSGRGLTDEYRRKWRTAIGKELHPFWVFLDRDGVINRNLPGDVTKLEDFEFLPNSVEALARLNQEGAQVVVISNQGSIARGDANVETIEGINAYMVEEVTKLGGSIDKVLYCPHEEKDGCDCRKPGTKLFVKAAEEFDIDLGKSFAVGDQNTDIEAAKKVGAFAILVLGGVAQFPLSNWKGAYPDAIVADLAAAADLIIGKMKT